MSRSSITTRPDRLAPVHPGEVLEQELLIPMGLSAYRVAVDIGVAPPRINDILLCRRAIMTSISSAIESRISPTSHGSTGTTPPMMTFGRPNAVPTGHPVTSPPVSLALLRQLIHEP